MGNTTVGFFQDQEGTSELKKLPKRLHEITTQNDEAKLLIADAYEFRKKELFSDAIETLLEAILLLKEENNDLDLGYCYNEIGEIYESINDEKSALDYYSLSEFIYKKTEKVTLTKIINLTNLGAIYSIYSRFPKALQRLSKAQTYALPFPDKRALLQVYTNMSQLFIIKKEFESAMKYMEEGLKVVETDGNFSETNIRGNRINMVSAYLQFEETEKAEALLKTVDENIDYYDHLIRIYYNWACIYVNKKQYTKALSYVKKARETLKDESSSYHVALNMIEADIYLKLGDHKKAISILENTLDDVLRFKRLGHQKIMFSLLAKAYEEIGNHKKSNEALAEYIAINDSIYELGKASEAFFLKADFDAEKATFALEKKEEELAYMEEKSNMRSLYNTILGISFILLLLLLILVFKKQRKLLRSERKTQLLEKEALQQTIEFQNKQVIDFSLHIKEKNKLLQNIKKKILKIYKQDANNKPLLSNVLSSINEDIRKNESQIELYTKVQENNGDFLENLSKLYPDLTVKEKEIILMLRLDASSKQIATRLQLSINSVDTYRSKIRNKINVPKKQKLSEYIKEI
ncbi:LuxR C-terminal-related transcriptional regulator [uncultured Kordia sp.]|uniref:tetratricopeptide repeat protein n=1 Tax=uncultured Kordia sp. TaxID=507699 RepID=UPI002638A95A|nr:LuxR C-terminal-related transcriptional regulator [uncultured Kordia sp.]